MRGYKRRKKIDNENTTNKGLSCLKIGIRIFFNNNVCISKRNSMS